jgi:hypothetical protein
MAEEPEHPHLPSLQIIERVKWTESGLPITGTKKTSRK